MTWAEIGLAPIVAVVPVLGVPLEGVLITTEVALTDIDIAYWSYTYRVAQNPSENQKFELLPLWGFGEKR